MKMLSRLLFVVVLLSAAACCGPKVGDVVIRPKAGDVLIKPWSLMTKNGKRIECELGTLYVPENRSNPKSRVIGVGFLRIRASEATSAPPTIHLPGGPGNSFLVDFRVHEFCPADRIVESRFVADIERYRSVGDVIFFDQRGYSRCGDVLTYSYQTKDIPLDQPSSIARDCADEVEMAKAAVAQFRNTRVDLSGYTIKECAADVNDLRRALHYNQVTLIGESFGGQWAFATIRLFPTMVARAIISGVEPLGAGYDMPSELYAAMQRMWRTAEQQCPIRPYLPCDGSGIAGAVREVFRQLEEKPRRVTIGTGHTSRTVTLGPVDFLPLAMEPAQILACYHGYFETLAKDELTRRVSHRESVALIKWLIDVSTGVAPARQQLLREDPAADIVGRSVVEAALATKGIWPTPDAGDDFRSEIPCDVPVLFVQGDWDRSSPAENLRLVQPYFVNSHTIVVRNGDHEAFIKVRRDPRFSGVMSAIMDFLRTGSTLNLPTCVTLDPHAFHPPGFPPPDCLGAKTD